MNTENKYNITAYNLFDFLLEVQKAVQQGFELSSDNENFPQAHISLFTVTLIKPEVVAKVETNVADTTTTDLGVVTAQDLTKEVTITDMVNNSTKAPVGRKPKVQNK